MVSHSKVIGRRSPYSMTYFLFFRYPHRRPLTTWRPLIASLRLFEPNQSTIHSTTAATGSRVGLFTEHSQITQHRQPAPSRAAVALSSISRFRLIFFCQNALRVFGHLNK